jgi:hypothetical protein
MVADRHFAGGPPTLGRLSDAVTRARPDEYRTTRRAKQSVLALQTKVSGVRCGAPPHRAIAQVAKIGI